MIKRKAPGIRSINRKAPVTVTVTADSNGDWSLSIDGTNSGSLSLDHDVTLTATATSTDAYNNSASHSANVTIDAHTADPSFVFTTGSDGSSDNTPELVGTAEPGSTVSITVTDSLTPANSETFTVTADSNGDWSLSIDGTNSGSLSLDHDVTLTATATSTDAYNNSASHSANVTIDAHTADPSFVFTTGSDGSSDNTPELVGTAEPGSTVSITVTDSLTPANSETFTVTADSNGDWSLSIDGTNSGSLSLDHDVTLTATATSTDAYNNSASHSANVTIDAHTADPSFVFTTGSDGSSDNTPELVGTAEPGSTVSITVTDSLTPANSETFTVTADSNGDWSLSID